jgi:beta-galactosidase
MPRLLAAFCWVIAIGTVSVTADDKPARPQANGPFGNCISRQTGVKLLDDLSLARQVWTSECRELGFAKGELRMIDPADGQVLWTLTGLMATHFTLTCSDRHVFVNLPSKIEERPGQPRPVYDDVARAGRELKTAAAVLAGTAVRPRVALAWSYRDRAVIETCPFHKDYDAWHHWRDQYGALRRLGLDVEVLRADQGLDGYDLVFAPQMIMLDPSLEQRLVAYVRGGGHLVLGPRSGFVNADGALLPSRAPGATLAALAGGHSVEHYSLPAPVPVGDALPGQALIWAEWLEADAPDTETVLRYGPGHAWLDGQAALLTRRVGQGRISLLGAWLDMPGLVNVAEWACRQAGVPLPWGRLPAGIEVSCRQAAERRVYIICSHAASACSLRLPFSATDALSGRPLGTDIVVPGNDVVVALESR